jgi:hypothetical protein
MVEVLLIKGKCNTFLALLDFDFNALNNLMCAVIGTGLSD